ncbi:xylose isomerase-like protein, partial [Aureobasidium melanogenum]
MQYRVAIPTVSLGRAAHHDLELKLDQAARYGFKGIEIFYEDLEKLASSPKYAISSSEEDNLLGAAAAVRASCLEHGMEIICLQPFSHYEGLVDRDEHQQMIHKAMFWLSLAQALGTTIIQIPTSFREDGTTGDRDLIVQDMIEVADLGAQTTPPIKFAYENLCWGRHLDTWEEVWDVVKRVDRANFGMCLDTFNITGRIWADPTAVDGKTPEADDTLRLSLEQLKAIVDVAKVFYIQVVDAEKMDPALGLDHPFHCRDQPPRMSWSRNARLFALEENGYLPILDVLKAITSPQGLNFQGWISFELFSASLSQADTSVPEQHAKRGMQSWKRLVETMDWK